MREAECVEGGMPEAMGVRTHSEPGVDSDPSTIDSVNAAVNKP